MRTSWIVLTVMTTACGAGTTTLSADSGPGPASNDAGVVGDGGAPTRGSPCRTSSDCGPPSAICTNNGILCPYCDLGQDPLFCPWTHGPCMADADCATVIRHQSGLRAGREFIYCGPHRVHDAALGNSVTGILDELQS